MMTAMGQYIIRYTYWTQYGAESKPGSVKMSEEEAREEVKRIMQDPKKPKNLLAAEPSEVH